MDRRKFLIGMGTASIGGSTLLGTGAFTRVEVQRRVKIQVAHDSDAYLGLDRCHLNGEERAPNSSYIDFQDGHLAIEMSPENPTDAGGEGINSDSRTWFHNVFQICNQGKQEVCVWINDHEDWPRVDDDAFEADYSAYDGDRRVDFYLEDDDERSFIGEDNHVRLAVGDCVCVGLMTNTKGLKEGDQLLEELDNEIVIHADADCPTVTLPECPFYGTSRSDPTAIFSIRYDSGTDTIVEQQVGVIPDESTDSNYPNGIAFDDSNDVWFFAEDTGELKTMNEDGSFGIEDYGVITPDGEPIAGAAFWDATGEYLFIPNGGDTLMAADISGGAASTRVVVELDWSGIGLGDLAIDREGQMLYVSTTRTNESGPNFFTVNLNNLTEQTEIVASTDRTAYAVRSQIAFDETGTMWAHNAGTGDWRTADLTDGSLSELIATTREYTDLARCGFYEGYQE